MTRVRIAQLKARLSTYVRAAQAGTRITVLDRDTPVALLVPLPDRHELRMLPPRHKSNNPWRVPRISRMDSDGDIVELLLEDRRRR